MQHTTAQATLIHFAKVDIFLIQKTKKTILFFSLYLERFPLNIILPTIFQKYFQSVRKGCSK